VYLLGAAAFAAVPLSLGYMGISWDAVNHHIYLGWTAEQPRFERDFIAAAYQSYQFPYLYWPFYRLAMANVSGSTAGVVLALLHSTAIPAVWLIARSCIPGKDLFDAGMRVLAVVLAFMSGVILSLFDSTSNDLMASIPLLWAYAFALRPLATADASPMRHAVASGMLGGMAVAFKLSNGFMVLALPLLWLWPAGPLQARARRTFAGGIALVAGLVLFYGYWGWQLWSHFGNPVYPLYDPVFAQLREALGWHR
jgi:hypothetical protein